MIRRKLKNVIKNFTECEILVREATSNEPWGPTNSLLSKIAELSNDESNILQIMPIIWKRLKDRGRKWRHVYKSLLLLIFLVTRGNSAVTIAECCRKNIHFIQSLESFSHTEDNVDVGSRIRKRAAELATLLMDGELLKIERQKAMITDMRFSKEVVSQGSNVPVKYGNGVSSLSQGPSTGSFISNSDNNKDAVKTDYPIPSSSMEEDIQLQIALAESKEEAEKLKQAEEIEQLTDKYKLDIAIVNNLKENQFGDRFDTELWDEEKVVVDTFNDPWSPELEKKEIVVDRTHEVDPWSQNIASNESLWSHSAKNVSLDPWSINGCSQVDYQLNDEWPIDRFVPVNNRSNNDVTRVNEEWSLDKSDPIDYKLSNIEVKRLEDPWASEEQRVVDDNPWRAEDEICTNPWSNSQILTNQIRRKNCGGDNDKGDGVIRFLADHDHLVNIDSLLSLDDSIKQTRIQRNPFLGDYNNSEERVTVSPYNPFLVSTVSNISNVPEELRSQSKSSVHYNPFLT